MSTEGLRQARVISTADPLNHGRVRLQVPQVSGSAATGWAPPIQSGGRIPAVGETVWVAYQGGDASYPAYIPPLPAPPVPPEPFAPLVSQQVSEPSYSPTSTWVAFTEAQWPSLSFTVPPSGLFWVTISGRIRNINGAESTVWMTWKITGEHEEGPTDRWGLTSANSARQQASHRYLVSTVAAGAAITVVPHWNVSSYSAGNVLVQHGHLYIERVGHS
ncbi:phage baseplate assembly protein V [Streptomyces sp. NPDC017448]|uniref:phage baseplate assembly protein V n=1 Tax=Streptomyces sp. NPDC017448 TaxID=3364996 RepID=UPI0037910B26